MGNLGEVFEKVRHDVADLLRSLPREDLDRPVPATPGWRIRDVAAHLAADAAYARVGNFPNEFFQAFGDEAAVVTLNEWTSTQLAERADAPLDALLDEWEEAAADVQKMMSGELAWPEGMPWFSDRVLLTDLAVHQQDLFGALGQVGERESPQVKLGLNGYIVTMDFRLRSASGDAMRFEAGEKTWDVGGDIPTATVRATRFELFRAMSGRRSPEQIKAYDWDGDPEPFVAYFYPYGVRAEALDE